MGKARLDNVQFVKALMERSDFGPLAQVFIVYAIERYAADVATAPDSAFADMANGFISPAAWQGVAREIQKKLVARSNG